MSFSTIFCSTSAIIKRLYHDSVGKSKVRIVICPYPVNNKRNRSICTFPVPALLIPENKQSLSFHMFPQCSRPKFLSQLLIFLVINFRETFSEKKRTREQFSSHSLVLFLPVSVFFNNQMLSGFRYLIRNIFYQFISRTV